MPRPWLPGRCTAHRDDSAAGGRSNPVARSTRSRRGRYLGAARASRSPRLPLCWLGERSAAPGYPRQSRGGLPRLRDTPDWLLKRWTAAYGKDNARAIALANAQEPALDITVKTNAEEWAERLHGRVLPTGSVRTLAQGAVSLLPGFREGAWWVQDAAASMPVRLFGDLAGQRVADLCAAPGGKTAQLAQAGAQVTAIDRAPARLARLRENLTRLSLNAEVAAADVLEFKAEPFDA